LRWSAHRTGFSLPVRDNRNTAAAMGARIKERARARRLQSHRPSTFAASTRLLTQAAQQWNRRTTRFYLPQGYRQTQAVGYALTRSWRFITQQPLRSPHSLWPYAYNPYGSCRNKRGWAPYRERVPRKGPSGVGSVGTVRACERDSLLALRVGGGQVCCCDTQDGFVSLSTPAARFALWLEVARQWLAVDYAQPFFQYVPCSGGGCADMRFNGGIGCAS